MLGVVFFVFSQFSAIIIIVFIKKFACPIEDINSIEGNVNIFV